MALVESFSGIRGIYPREFNQEIARRYACAFSQFLGPEKSKAGIVLGMDTRPSGPELRMPIIEGVSCNVTDCGIAPTPVIENAVRAFHAAGGIMVTASHNEPEFNGMKFFGPDGSILTCDDMQIVIDAYHNLRRMDEEQFIEHTSGTGLTIKNIEKRDAIRPYKKFLRAPKIGPARILIDPNGGAGIMLEPLLRQKGITWINMGAGQFRRKIEPTEQSLSYLLQAMKEHGAEFAAGFDCDADRVEIILPDGTPVSGNHLLAIIVDDVLSSCKNPEDEIVVVNDATSYMVREIVNKHSAQWMEVEVGETNVISTMLHYDSPIGGEGSNGGIIIPPSRCRDGMMTLFRLLSILEKKGATLPELIKQLPDYHYRKEVISENFSRVRAKVKEIYLKKGFTVKETGADGGLKAIGPDGWIWLRQSRTEDGIIRIIADSQKEKAANQLIDDARKAVIFK